MYELLIAAILGAIAVLLAGTYAGLWVMRRRWIDTRRDLSALRVAVARAEYGRQLDELDDEGDVEESPEERRRRFYIVPPLAAPIGALLGAAAAWIRKHLWKPARARPVVAAGALTAAAAVAFAAVPTGSDSTRADDDPPVSAASPPPSAPGSAGPGPTPSSSPKDIRAGTDNHRGAPVPSPTTTPAPPAAGPMSRTSPPAASSTPPAEPMSRTSPPAASSTPPAESTTPGTASGGDGTSISEPSEDTGAGDDGDTPGGDDAGGTTPPDETSPPPDESCDGLLRLDINLKPIPRVDLCLL